MKMRGRFALGFLIGATMCVPGASGGTMAMLLGVYEEMLGAVADLFRDFRRNGLLLLTLGGGGLLGILAAGRSVESLLFFYPYETGFFFAGCIAGGIPFLVGEGLHGYKKSFLWPLLALLIGAGVGVLLPLCPGLFRGEGFLWLAFAGLILAVALVLPGVSASACLYILGLYDPLPEAVAGREVAFLLPLALGCLVGVFLTARIFTRLLMRHGAISRVLIAGFLIASAAESLPYGVAGVLPIGLCAFGLGFLALFLLSGGGGWLKNLWRGRGARGAAAAQPDRGCAGPGTTAL